MRFKLFSIYVFLFTFCVFAFGSGSGGVAPKLEFKYYQAGQGDANSKTFITNTETTCKLTVKVGYADSQPANAYKLKRCGWKVAAEILLPGLSDEEKKKHTFTFTGEGTQSDDPGSTSTTFTYSGDGTLSKHWSPSGDVKKKREYCPNYSGTKKPDKGRQLKIDVTFIGYYGTDPNNEQKVEIKLPLIQDEKDQMRQEYLDQGRYVPSRSDVKDTNDYNHGHYGKMMDGGLLGYHDEWVEKCNERYRQCNESHNCEHNTNKETVCKPPNCPVKGCDHTDIDDFTRANLSLNSGYRHPHHNVYHVGATATHGLHQYGVALDIKTPDVDGDGTVEQVYNNEAKSKDAIAMEDAAGAAGADYTASYKKYKYSKITHADWRNDYKTSWPPKINASGQLSSNVSLQENTSAITTTESTTETTTPAMAACGIHTTSDSGYHCDSGYTCAIHSGFLCQESSDHKTQITGYSGTFYECQPHTTGFCGHTHLTANASDHSWIIPPCSDDTHAMVCLSSGFRP